MLSIIALMKSQVQKNQVPSILEKKANGEFIARRQKRLIKNYEAERLLSEFGISVSAVRNFHLGLSEPYRLKNGAVRENTLIAPVIDRTGQPMNRSIFFNLPSVTKNPAAEHQWMKAATSPPRTYYSERFWNQEQVFVCHRCFDLWSVWELADVVRKSNMLLIASTCLERLPDEWKDPSFWTLFKSIYLAFDNTPNGDRLAAQISGLADIETRRVLYPSSDIQNWNEFRMRHTNAGEFERLLETTQIVEKSAIQNFEPLLSGRYSYQPVDVNSAFHRGHLYYPVRTLLSQTEHSASAEENTSEKVTARLETVVIRSDRQIFTAHQVSAPRGTPSTDRIWQLTDGTVLDSAPRASAYSTWSWKSIERFLSGSGNRRPLNSILTDVKSFLKKSVWLPHSSDYDLLTLLTPVTFAQSLFQSVPMILVTGPPGSGKSALGGAMTQICANSVFVGQTSAAAIARLINETRGFVVLDDLESVGLRQRGRDKSTFSELIQALKLSYNRETSCKIWTDMRGGMRVERLNFFGVKMINNTTGADPILGSRMLRIRTAAIPSAVIEEFESHDAEESIVSPDLRDELHTWVFENVGLIDLTYKRLSSHLNNRSAEIAAPLRVFAELAGDRELSKGLSFTLETQTADITHPVAPVDILKRAMKILIAEGFFKVSPTHVSLEMKSLVQSLPNREEIMKSFDWQQPAWIGKQLRANNCVARNAACARHLLFGKLLRIYPVSQEFITEALDSTPSTKNIIAQEPTAFCQECRECRYRALNCPIMESRYQP
jgi:hypothetical protein